MSNDTVIAGRTAPLRARLEEAQDRLASMPSWEESTTALASVEHCAAQIAYWRAVQCIAAIEVTSRDEKTREYGDYMLKLSSREAREWEQRKCAADKQVEGDRMATILQKIAFLEEQGDLLDELEEDAQAD